MIETPARPFLPAALAAALLALSASLSAGCSGARSGGVRPLPADDPAVDGVPVSYEVECQTCTVSWLTAEGLKTRSAAGSWRREIVARRGDALRLVVERDRGRSTSVEARIRVRGETAAFGRLGPGDLRDRLSLRARAG